MLIMKPISLKDLDDCFRLVILVGINWSPFINESWSINIIMVLDRKSLGVSILL